ncbi:MAG: MutS-related protein [Saccharofermentanales bacterium]
MGYSVDLFYPVNKRDNKTSGFARYPADFIHDLELEVIAKYIYPQNSAYALNIFREMNTDGEIIKYRQDILTDFMTVPGLENILYNTINEIYTNENALESKHKNTESFSEIGISVRLLEGYISSITKCYEVIKNFDVASSGLKELIANIKAIYNSDDFKVLSKEVADLSEVISHGLNSMTIGINFDDYMRPSDMAILSVSSKYFTQRTLFSKMFNKKSTDEMKIDPVGTMHTINRNESPTNFELALFDDLKNMRQDLLNHFAIAMKLYYDLNIRLFFDLKLQLDFYIGAKKLINNLKDRGIKWCCPKIAAKEDRVFHIKDMTEISFTLTTFKTDFNMNLGKAIVANDISMDDNGRIFILTGPNHGGKTTFTRAVGVSQVLFQAGLFVPGSEALISPADWIYTHFTREEVVGINTSRLTQECKQFKVTFALATRYSLLLMNESFSSTKYTESLYIAAGFIKLMRKMGCRSIYTTHITDLALNIDEMEAQVDGDSKIVSIVSGVTDENNKISGDKTLNRSYKVKKSAPYDFSYAHDVLVKYGIDFDKMLGGETK